MLCVPGTSSIRFASIGIDFLAISVLFSTNFQSVVVVVECSKICSAREIAVPLNFNF